jgi:hypothetical protein
MEAPRIATPRFIYIALVLLLFSAATPFIGGYVSDHTPGNGAMILGPFVEWVLAGAAAGFLGVVCTLIGAWRGPRSTITKLAVALLLR